MVNEPLQVEFLVTDTTTTRELQQRLDTMARHLHLTLGPPTWGDVYEHDGGQWVTCTAPNYTPRRKPHIETSTEDWAESQRQAAKVLLAQLRAAT